MASITKQLDHWQFDAQEAGTGAVDVTGGALNANAATQYIGLVFEDSSFFDLKGATITNAYLELYFTSGSYDSPDATLCGHDADYSSPFLGTTYEISSLPQTTAGVTWSASDIGTGWKTSSDIKAVIQEIVDRAGWPKTVIDHPAYPPNPNLNIIVKGNSSSSFLRIRSYDGNSSQAAKLTVNYEVAGQPAIARARLVPGMRRPHGSQGW